MKSFTITLCPTLCRYKLSDSNQCSLEGKSIYCGLNLLWNSEKSLYREIYKVLLSATKIMKLAEKDNYRFG